MRRALTAFITASIMGACTDHSGFTVASDAGADSSAPSHPDAQTEKDAADPTDSAAPHDAAAHDDAAAGDATPGVEAGNDGAAQAADCQQLCLALNMEMTCDFTNSPDQMLTLTQTKPNGCSGHPDSSTEIALTCDDQQVCITFASTTTCYPAQFTTTSFSYGWQDDAGSSEHITCVLP